MTEPGWRSAQLEDIPPRVEVPGSEAMPIDERDPAAAKRWRAFAEDYPDNDRRFFSIRRFLGVSSFGVNAAEASAGNCLLVPHDETEYGQEELYLVLRGRARFVLEGEDVELGEGGLVLVQPEVHRTAFALETPTRLLLLGGLPGRPYEPPTWSPDWRLRATGG